MTFPLKSTVIHVGLLALGLAAWAGAGSSLRERGAFQFVPNAFSLKGSPFGRTLAMAMQGPADVYFHQGEGHEAAGDHKHGPGEECTSCSEAEAKQKSIEDAITSATGGTPEAEPATDHDQLLVTTGGSEADRHGHVHGESCTSSCDHGAEEVPAIEDDGLRTAILGKIRDWRGVKNSRTNPHGNSEAHKFFIRAEVEKKLFLTYQMDPTNYGSYGSYFLFLNETSLGTQGDRSREQARRLSEATVARCVREWDNPIALLTAAAASHDMVQFLVEDPSQEAAQRAHDYATLAGQSLDQFDQVSLQMLFDGTWERFSPARQDEMAQRAQLLRKLHEADQQTLRVRVANPSKPEGQPAG